MPGWREHRSRGRKAVACLPSQFKHPTFIPCMSGLLSSPSASMQACDCLGGKEKQSPISRGTQESSLSSLWIANCPSATGLVVSHCANNGCMRAKLLQSSLILQPTRLLCPWYSPGKNTGVGCHALLLGNLLNPRIEPASPSAPILQADSLS